MRKLFLTIAGAVFFLALFDAAATRVIYSRHSGEEVDSERTRAFARIVTRQFEELRRDSAAAVERAYYRWAALLDRKEEGEMRIFVSV